MVVDIILLIVVFTLAVYGILFSVRLGMKTKILSDLKQRLEVAEIIHENSLKELAEHGSTDMRTKECAWGKIVAYRHAIKMVSKLI